MNDEGQIRQLVWRPSAHLAKRRSKRNSWYWTGKAPNTKDQQDCCATDAISFHPTKKPDEMIKLWGQITGVVPLGDSVEDNYLKRVRDYYLRNDPK